MRELSRFGSILLFGVVFGGVPWIVFRSIVLIWRKNYQHVSIGRELLLITFAIYCIAVTRVTIFPLQYDLVGQKPSINFVPFVDILTGFYHSTFSFAFKLKLLLRNLLGNVLLLLPLGFFLPLLWVKFRALRKTLVIGVIISVAIETAQYVLVYLRLNEGRVSDIDDVILNSIGTIIGYLIFQFVLNGLRRAQVYKGV